MANKYEGDNLRPFEGRKNKLSPSFGLVKKKGIGSDLKLNEENPFPRVAGIKSLEDKYPFTYLSSENIKEPGLPLVKQPPKVLQDKIADLNQALARGTASIHETKEVSNDALNAGQPLKLRGHFPEGSDHKRYQIVDTRDPFAKDFMSPSLNEQIDAARQSGATEIILAGRGLNGETIRAKLSALGEIVEDTQRPQAPGKRSK